MGIAYKDLKAGTYYKGTDSGGAKFFLFVETIASHHAPNVQLTSWVVQRRTGAGSWRQIANQILPETGDSNARRAVTLAEVQAENIPQCPGDSTSGRNVATPVVAPASSTPVPGSSKSPTTSSSTGTERMPTRSAPPSKPPALRKNGQPKVVVPDNNRSPNCLCCGKQNKTLVLLQFSTFWCPDCEP